MLAYTTRRLLLTLPMLLAIAAVIFALLEAATGDPMAALPQTIPAEVREAMRAALGLGEPAHIRFGKWLWQIFVVEPMVAVDALFGFDATQGTQRILSWQTRSPVMAVIAERLPQTLWVVGAAYVLGTLIALPLGIWSAYRQHSAFDHIATVTIMIGYAVPPFFSGLLLILLFSVRLDWFPSYYDTTLEVRDWASFTEQLRQMALPVLVLSLQTTAQISRYMRAAMLDSLGKGYMRTARAKGLPERTVLGVHGLRNSLIPVVTVVTLGVPQVFAGAIITENIFLVNGLGHLLVTSIEAGDLPMVQTVTFMLAVLIVLFNLLADLLYALLDPRVRLGAAA